MKPDVNDSREAIHGLETRKVCDCDEVENGTDHCTGLTVLTNCVTTVQELRFVDTRQE